MRRQSDSDAGRMARGAELRRRVRALNEHVLGQPEENGETLIRLVLYLVLALGRIATLAGLEAVTEMKP